ncbi:LacI family transcriptional regulator [Marinilabiliaceae bacterium JC017]|nr:LacI family transcriptional regulator [Marinilabiliaceae bacterium JC017]
MSDKNKSEVTINDIARALGISASTVSRSLNDSSKISEKTKSRVREMAVELGYELNLVASSLSKSKTNLIGVIIPRLNSQFFSQAVSGIEEVARQSGYQIIICQSNEDFTKECEMAKVLYSTRVDGVVACLSKETTTVEHFNVFIQKKVPVAMFDRVSYAIEGPKVVVDNYEGAYRATEHLIASGCTRLAHLAGPQNCKVFQERAEGFRDALKKAGLPLLPRHLLASDLNEKDVRDSMALWMGLKEAPDGIFTASATSGLLMLNLVRNYNVRVPEDMAFISFGNEPCNELITPSLSAVDMPGLDMGKAAAKHLVDAIEKKQNGDGIFLKPIQLLIRNSSFR